MGLFDSMANGRPMYPAYLIDQPWTPTEPTALGMMAEMGMNSRKAEAKKEGEEDKEKKSDIPDAMKGQSSNWIDRRDRINAMEKTNEARFNSLYKDPLVNGDMNKLQSDKRFAPIYSDMMEVEKLKNMNEKDRITGKAYLEEKNKSLASLSSKNSTELYAYKDGKVIGLDSNGNLTTDSSKFDKPLTKLEYTNYIDNDRRTDKNGLNATPEFQYGLDIDSANKALKSYLDTAKDSFQQYETAKKNVGILGDKVEVQSNVVRSNELALNLADGFTKNLTPEEQEALDQTYYGKYYNNSEDLFTDKDENGKLLPKTKDGKQEKRKMTKDEYIKDLVLNQKQIRYSKSVDNKTEWIKDDEEGSGSGSGESGKFNNYYEKLKQGQGTYTDNFGVVHYGLSWKTGVIDFGQEMNKLMGGKDAYSQLVRNIIKPKYDQAVKQYKALDPNAPKKYKNANDYFWQTKLTPEERNKLYGMATSNQAAQNIDSNRELLGSSPASLGSVMDLMDSWFPNDKTSNSKTNMFGGFTSNEVTKLSNQIKYTIYQGEQKVAPIGDWTPIIGEGGNSITNIKNTKDVRRPLIVHTTYGAHLKSGTDNSHDRSLLQQVMIIPKDDKMLSQIPYTYYDIKTNTWKESDYLTMKDAAGVKESQAGLMLPKMEKNDKGDDMGTFGYKEGDSVYVVIVYSDMDDYINEKLFSKQPLKSDIANPVPANTAEDEMTSGKINFSLFKKQ